MEDLLMGLLKEVPGAGAVILAVWMMLSYLRDQDKAHRQEMRDLHSRTRDVAEDATQALVSNTQAVTRLEGKLQ